jgi:shikimate dehydrogenase
MSGSSGLAGVIGWPARHSLSPVLHRHWLNRHKIAGDFVSLPVRPADFGLIIRALPRMGFAGVNVTVPHKEAAFALAQSLDDDARACGAVNLLVFDGGTIRGANTDAQGFSASMEQSLGAGALRIGPVVVLGAGGAARAVLLALIRAGASEIRLLNRTRARAETLARLFEKAPIRVIDWSDRAQALSGAMLLVNTTSLGMAGQDPLDIPLDALPAAAAVADIVYRPLETDLLRAARARGLRTADGLGMLMHQAVPAFAAFYGVTPAVTPELRAPLEAALHG